MPAPHRVVRVVVGALVTASLLAACSDDLTDCSSYVERAGGKVCVVEGDRLLAKVTTAEDLAALEALL